MNAAQLIALIQAGLSVGMTATEIAQKLCLSHGGQSLPTLEEFETRVDSLRDKPDLSQG